MRYIAAYLLAVMGGNPSPSEEDIRAIVSSVGIDIDEFRLQKVMNELKGKDLEELIAIGSEKLVTAGVGGGGNVTAAVQQGEGNTSAQDKATDKQAEVAADDDGGSSDEDFGMGLFDME